MSGDTAFISGTMTRSEQPTSDSGARLRSAFDDVLDIEPAARAAWIEANVTDAADRAALHRLLAADHDRGFLDTPVVEHTARISRTRAKS